MQGYGSGKVFGDSYYQAQSEHKKFHSVMTFTICKKWFIMENGLGSYEGGQDLQSATCKLVTQESWCCESESKGLRIRTEMGAGVNPRV